MYKSMDFARKHLEKYGWTAGKGLGRHEDGIREALKPQLKRSTAGVGHDAAKDFTDHWWNKLYDKASGNIQVKTTKNGKTKKITVKDPDAVELTNKTWSVKKKKTQNGDPVKENDGYMEHFVRKAILTSGGAVTTRLDDDKSENSGSDDNDKDVATDGKKSILQMTDEELFAACGGRTAHKGARHGLRATGKLARVEEQEALLLKDSRFNGYSHKTKLNIAESTKKEEKKKEKIRKKSEKEDINRENCRENEIQSESITNNKFRTNDEKFNATDVNGLSNCDFIPVNRQKNSKKKKKESKKEDESNVFQENEIQLNDIKITENTITELHVENKEKISKKKKRKLEKKVKENVNDEMCENGKHRNDVKINEELSSDFTVENIPKKKKKRKSEKDVEENQNEGVWKENDITE